MDEQKKRSLSSMIGICKKAGRAVCTTEQVCEALKKGGVCAVLCASDASDNTKKRLNDKCKYYGAKIIDLPLTCDELGSAVGKSGSVAAVGITDAGLCAAVENKLR
jgi:ribosomal protein L7Ae-like RNA K-turn-binding protein